MIIVITLFFAVTYTTYAALSENGLYLMFAELQASFFEARDFLLSNEACHRMIKFERAWEPLINL